MASIIILSDDDDEEDECSFIDEVVHVQPPHMVFINQGTLQESLLREDENYMNEDQQLVSTHYTEVEDESQISFVKPTSSLLRDPFEENGRSEELVEQLESTLCAEEEAETIFAKPTSSLLHDHFEEERRLEELVWRSCKADKEVYDEETNDTNEDNIDQDSNFRKALVNKPSSSVNDVVFQRLAEALSNVITPSSSMSNERFNNKEQCNTDLHLDTSVILRTNIKTSTISVNSHNLDTDDTNSSTISIRTRDLDTNDSNTISVPTPDLDTDDGDGILNISVKNHNLGNDFSTFSSDICVKSENSDTKGLERFSRLPVDTLETNDKTVMNTHSCKEGDINDRLIKTTEGGNKRGIKRSWRKNAEPNLVPNEIYNSSASPRKKRGRKPGWSENAEPNPVTNEITNSSASPRKKPGRKPGWRKNAEPNPVTNEIYNSSASPRKKPGRKPGWRKNAEPNLVTKEISNSSASPRKKRGRQPGWRKNAEQTPVINEISNSSASPKQKHCRKPGLGENAEPNQVTNEINEELVKTTDGCKKRGRIIGWRKNAKPAPAVNQIVSDVNTTPKKKCGRKPGWKKVDQSNARTITEENSTMTVENQQENSDLEKSKNFVNNSELSFKNNDLNICDKNDSSTVLVSNNEISTQPNINPQSFKKGDINEGFVKTTSGCKKRGRKRGWKKVDQSNSHTITEDNSTMTVENQKEKSDLEKTSHFSISENSFKDIQNSSYENSSIVDKSLYENKVNIHDQMSHLSNSFVENTKETSKINICEHKHTQDIASRLTGHNEQDRIILREDFVSCYNKTFDDNAECLILRLADMLRLMMGEVEKHNLRHASAQIISFEELQKETNISDTSFSNILNKIRTSFYSVFHEIIQHILLDVEIVYQHKALLLALFLKTFSRISSTSPNYSDKLILAKHSLTIVLKQYLTSVPEYIRRSLLETFWISDTDFERNCWFILDFFVASLPIENCHPTDDLYVNKKKITFENRSQCITDRTDSLAGTVVDSRKVSVIVRNQQNYSSPSVNDKVFETPQLDIRERGQNTQEFKSLSYNISEQESAKSFSTSELIEALIQKHFNLSLNKAVHENGEIPFQNDREVSLSGLKPNNQATKKDLTIHDLIGIKRKYVTSEDCHGKSIKPSENKHSQEKTIQNKDLQAKSYHNVRQQERSFQNYLQKSFQSITNTQHGDSISSQQQLSMNMPCPVQSEAMRRTSQDHSKRNVRCSTQKSEIYNPLQGNNHISSHASNSYQHISSGELRDRLITSYRVPPPSYAYTHHTVRSQPGPSPKPEDASTHRSHSDYLKITTGDKSSPTGHLQYDQQRLHRPLYSEGQQNAQVPKGGYHVRQSFPPSYTEQIKFLASQQNQICPNEDLLKNHHLCVNTASQVHGSRHSHPSHSHYNQTLTDPRRSMPRAPINSTPGHQLVGYTGVPQNTYITQHPGHSEAVRSNSGITINNYNINAYGPTRMAEHPNQKMNSASGGFRHTNQVWNPFDAPQVKSDPPPNATQSANHYN